MLCKKCKQLILNDLQHSNLHKEEILPEKKKFYPAETAQN
jgi:hypothetical protein